MNPDKNPRTGLDWICFLPEEIYVRALYNVYEHVERYYGKEFKEGAEGLLHVKLFNPRFATPSTAIQCLFPWTMTSEGVGYWKQVADILESIEKTVCPHQQQHEFIERADKKLLDDQLIRDTHGPLDNFMEGALPKAVRDKLPAETASKALVIEAYWESLGEIAKKCKLPHPAELSTNTAVSSATPDPSDVTSTRIEYSEHEIDTSFFDTD